MVHNLQHLAIFFTRISASVILYDFITYHEINMDLATSYARSQSLTLGMAALNRLNPPWTRLCLLSVETNSQ